MAIPSRVFVGLVVFGLIASLAIVPYTILALSGYEPGDGPLPGGAISGADKGVLVLASLFSVALTAFAWRGLVSGARRDAALRRERRQRGQEPPPPGYQ